MVPQAGPERMKSWRMLEDNGPATKALLACCDLGLCGPPFLFPPILKKCNSLGVSLGHEEGDSHNT